MEIKNKNDMKLVKFVTGKGFQFCVPLGLEYFAGNEKYKKIGIVKNEEIFFYNKRDEKNSIEIYNDIVSNKEKFIKIDLQLGNWIINLDKKETSEKEYKSLEKEVKKLKLEGKLTNASSVILRKMQNNL